MAGVVMLAGVALVAIVTAAVTSSFVARVHEQHRAEEATEATLEPQELWLPSRDAAADGVGDTAVSFAMR